MCGATMLASIIILYSETGLLLLSIRRRTHRLILFNKMYHCPAPRYLSSLISSQVGNVTTYNFRNSSYISCRTRLSSQSFLSSTFNSCNSPTDEFLSALSLNAFKSLWSRARKKVPLFYDDGDTHCSNLNEHLTNKYSRESTLCLGWYWRHIPTHFSFSCPLNLGSRFELFN